MNDNSIYRKKLGGSHTTIIGGRQGIKATGIVAKHPKVKKVAPSVIKTKQRASRGFSAKIQRPDSRGNLRLLIVEGTSFQEIRIITKISTVEEGNLLADELNKMIEEKMK